MTISQDSKGSNRHSGTSGTITMDTTKGGQLLLAIAHIVGKNGATDVGEISSITNSLGLVFQRRMRFANPFGWAAGPFGGSGTCCNAVEIWWAWSPAQLSSAVLTFNYSEAIDGASVSVSAMNGTFGSSDQTPWPASDTAVNSFSSLTANATATPGGTIDTTDTDNFVFAIYGGASSSNISLDGGSTGWTQLEGNNGDPGDFNTTLDYWIQDIGPTTGLAANGNSNQAQWIWVMDYILPIVSDVVGPDLPAQTELPSSTGTAGIGYTTTRDDEIMLLAVSHESNQAAPSWISSVTDTNGLTWARRARVTNADSRVTSAELWWAVVPTPMSGTITVDFSPNIDDATMTTVGFFNTNTAAPWDTDPSLPGLAVNALNSSSVVEATVSTKAESGYLLGFSSTGVAEAVGVPGGFTQIAAPHNSGGTNWSFAVLFGQELDAPQTSNTVSTGNNFSQWAFIVDALAKKSSAPSYVQRAAIANLMNG